MVKILIVEDEQDISENIAEFLEAEGFEATCASDGLDGLRVAREIHPDLILCDVMMPRLDGFQMLEALRSEQ